MSFSPGEYGYKGGNMDDKHWSIVCAEDQYGGNGNQRAYKKSTGKPDYLPSCHGDATNLKDDYQARTIVTTQWRAPGGGDVLQDGYITCKPDSMYHGIVGDASLVNNPDYCKRGVWRTSDSAKSYSRDYPVLKYIRL